MNRVRAFSICRAALIWPCLLLAAMPALGQVTALDLQVAGRALSFLQKPLRGDISVGIVYSTANPQSVQAAENLQKLFGDGLRVGESTLRPVLVPMTTLARVNVALLFLTPQSGAEADALASFAKAKQLPCVTTDLTQVQSGRCAVGIRSQPRIEIIVNRAAAAGSGVAFSAVFRLMITEI